MLSCSECKHVNVLPGQEPCYGCIEQSNFELDGSVTMMPVNKPEPLLTKNEYLALELTKIYAMQCCGQSKVALMKITIAESYSYFLDHFNNKDKEET